MRALIVGAGSVGGYFGGRLAAAGRDVTFLVRPRRAAQLADGLTIISKGEETTVRAKVITTGEAAGEFDLILLAVKAYQLDAAIGDFGAHVTERSMILPVLNGMRHVDILRSHFGSSHVIGGIAKIASTLDERGRILDQADFHDLAYGEWSRERSGRILALDQFMTGAGFNARLSLQTGDARRGTHTGSAAMARRSIHVHRVDASSPRTVALREALCRLSRAPSPEVPRALAGCLRTSPGSMNAVSRGGSHGVILIPDASSVDS